MSLLPSASSPFPFICQQVTGRWKRGQPLWADIMSCEGRDSDRGSTGDPWMGLSDVTAVMLSKHLQMLLEQVQDCALGCHLPPDRQAKKEPSSETFLIKGLPPACASPSVKKPASRLERGLLIPSSLILLCVFASCSSTATKSLLFLDVLLWEMAAIILVQHGLGTNTLCTVWFLLLQDFSPTKICLENTCFFPSEEKKRILVDYSTWNIMGKPFFFEVINTFQWNSEEKNSGFIFLQMIAK